MSALRTGRLYPPGNIPGTHFCQRPSRPQGHSAARRIMSMKNSNDTIWNRTRDLLVCSAVPQPNAPQRAPLTAYILDNLRKIFLIFLYVTQCKVLFSLLSIYKLHILVILISLSRTLHAVDHHNILSPPFALYTTHLSAPSFPEIVSYSAI